VKMMKTLLVLAIVCLVSAYATTPAFPAAYSSTMDVNRHSQQRYFVARWFRDEAKNVERFDSSGTGGWDIDIRRYDQGKQYNIYHMNGETVCVVTNLTGSIPKLDFSTFKWRAEVPLNGLPADQFDGPPNAQQTQYFQDAASFYPTRIVTSGPNKERVDFYDFNTGSQDVDLFDVGKVAGGLVCNNAPNAILGAVRMAWLDAPYSVKADYYTPPAMTASNITSGACETGQASWYSCSGNGACAACNPTEMIAAHKTIACGTSITVTNTANGKSVVVKVADRGPYVTGRIVDMNKQPASDLDMLSAGVVPCRVC